MQVQNASGSHHDLGPSQALDSTSPEHFAISELIICAAIWVVRNFCSVGSELRHKAEEYFPAVPLQVEHFKPRLSSPLPVASTLTHPPSELLP